MIKYHPSDVRAILRALLNVPIPTDREQLKMSSPFRDDQHPSFSINTNTGLWMDFGSGDTGNIEQLYYRLHNIEHAEDRFSRFLSEFPFLRQSNGFPVRPPKQPRFRMPGKLAASKKSYRLKTNAEKPTAITVYQIEHIDINNPSISTPGASPLIAEVGRLLDAIPMEYGEQLRARFAERLQRLDCQRVKPGNPSAQVWPVWSGGGIVSVKYMEYKGLKRGVGVSSFPKNATPGLFGDFWPDAPKATILVESEKSALLGGLVWPGFSWVAAGGAKGLSTAKSVLLKGRTVSVVFDLDQPGDTGTAQSIENLRKANVTVNTLHGEALRKALANDAGDTERKIEGYDLGDYAITCLRALGCAKTRLRAALLASVVNFNLTERQSPSQAAAYLWGDDGQRILTILSGFGLVKWDGEQLRAFATDAELQEAEALLLADVIEPNPTQDDIANLLQNLGRAY